MPGGEQGAGAFNHVAGPDQVITTQVGVPLLLPPGDAHGGHQSAGINLVFVRQQHETAQARKAAPVAGGLVEILRGGRQGAEPLAHINLAVLCEWNGERLGQFRGGALSASAKSHRENKLAIMGQIHLRRHCDVAVLGLLEFPIHLKVLQILPAIARAHKSHRALAKIRRRPEGQVHAIALRPQERPRVHIIGIGGVVLSQTFQVRSEQSINAQLRAQRGIGTLDPARHQDDGGMRIGEEFFNDAIAARWFGIREAVQERVFFRVFQGVLQVAPFLVKKSFTIRDQKLKIARIGTIDVGIINLVDDPVAEREPDAATAVISGADAFLRAASPARVHAGSAEGDSLVG